MNAKLVGVGLAIALIMSMVLVIVFVKPIDVQPPKDEDPFKNWNRSGPFAINKIEYKIGENVFLAVDKLTFNDVGNIVFVLPNGTTKYIVLPFNGEQKTEFNYYFKPSISKARNICSTNDIIGEWFVVFQGTQYQPLRFTILNETISTEIGNFQRVC